MNMVSPEFIAIRSLYCMKIPRDANIYVDTNIIIEAAKLGIQEHIQGHYSNLKTVNKCIEEIETGNRYSCQRLNIDTSFFKESSCEPSNIQLAELEIKLNNEMDLHAGEKHLFASIMSLKPGTFLVCSPDKASIRAAKKLGILNRMITFEELLASSGRDTVKLEQQFTRKWHDNFCLNLELGILQ
jgi:hypothetical protein